MRCSSCGTDNPAGTTFCVNCGSRLGGGAPPPSAPPPAAPPPQTAAVPPPPPPPKRKHDAKKLVTAIVTILGLLAGIIVFVQSRSAQASVIYEPPLQPGPDPFTSPIDVSATSVGAIIPTPSPTATQTLPSPDPNISPPTSPSPTIGSTTGGGFGGSGFTTVCDRELLVRSLQARPAALAEWARIRSLTLEAVPDYIRALKPVTLTEDARVTNYSFKGGKAKAFQSILPAGTAVLTDAADNVVTRCRCGNPLTEAKPVAKGTCKDCPKGYVAPAILPRGQAPRVVAAINPPAVVGATPTSSPSATPTAKPTPASTNLSVGATFAASATFSSQWHARYGIDNDKGTSWFSKGPEPKNGNTSTYTITLKAPSTLTRIEFWDNSENHQDRSVRSGFGFRSWKIQLLRADGSVITTVNPVSDPLKDQTLRLGAVAGVSKVRFIGSRHEDPTCGGFGALWAFGHAT